MRIFKIAPQNIYLFCDKRRYSKEECKYLICDSINDEEQSILTEKDGIEWTEIIKSYMKSKYPNIKQTMIINEIKPKWN